jgi:heme a synthase
MGRLLVIWAGMVLMIVVIGGVTRLTESGLSITEWAPVTGTIPPLSQQAWEETFQAYQQIPEYQQLNRGMTLDEFKNIYFWEYLHRLWARLVGLVIAVIFAYSLFRRGVSRQLNRRLGALLLLTAGQGVLGWFMVMSGLADRTDVSQYRLAAHLGLALVIYVVAIWTVADLWWAGDHGSTGNAEQSLRKAAGWVTVLVFMTAIMGAFVAGLDGGRVYNTFPLMGGKLVPDGYFAPVPWWRNLFENVTAVQFNHRWIAIATLGAIVWLWFRGQKQPVPPVSRHWLHALPIVGAIQVLLGVATLLMVVPIWLAALHQAGAVLLLTASLMFYHGLHRANSQQPTADD